MKTKHLLSSLFAALIFSGLQATVHNVSVGSNFFMPSSLSINQGDTVIWTNTGGFHNVNGTTTTFSNNPASFGNSVGSGWTYQFVFNTSGSYNYQCDPHSGSMQGTVTVAAAPPPAPAASDIIITGLYDGPLSGGTPKGVELYVLNNIPDLSQYGLGSANNGGGSDGQEFTFPAVSATAGSFIYVTTDSAQFNAFFGFDADYTDGSMAINGDDAVELFSNGTVIDVFGDINMDGSGEPWEYLDSWAYRVDGTGPDDSTFVLANWTFGGPNVLDGDTLNSTAATPVPIGTYDSTSAGGVVNVPGYPVATIASVTTSDAAFVPDSLNQQFELNGTIYTIDFDGNAGYSFYMYDNTGGINVFSFTDVAGYTSPAQGDSVTVYGEIVQFRGLTEIEVDSIELRSSGNALKMPATVFSLDESTEGEYVQINGVWVITPSQWPAMGSSANVDITNGTDTMTLRIDSDTDIDGSPVPNAPFNVRGAGSQFTFAIPANDGYQILPSSLMDIMTIPASTVPNYDIATATSVDANGVPDSLNVEMELRGTVYSIDFDGNAGISIYMYDTTGGINVFNFNDVGNYVNPQQGDSISVFGDIAQFRGLTEIFADSIVLWSTGNILKNPATVTTLDETTEGEYVQLDSVQLVDPTQWPAMGSSANVDIYNSTDTLTLRIDSDTDIDGSAAPVGLFQVRGAGSQFTFTNPALDGYQILPSSLNDITVYPPANPTINFAMGPQTVGEAVGTVTIDLLVNPVATVSTTVDLQFMLGANVNIPADGTVSPAPNLTTGLLTLTIPANEDTVSFDISIVDDAMLEGNETLFYSINAVSAGLLQGALDSAFLVVIDNDAAMAGIPTYDIADLTTSDATGVADSLNAMAKINVVVYTDDFDGNNGYSFYAYDNTGGINIFNFNDVGSYQVSRGDSLRLIGSIAQFNGLTEFVPDSIVVLDSNVTLKMPTVVTDLDETTEGEYIRMNGMTLVTPSQWPTTAGNSANVDITNGTDTVVMRIDSDTDIDGTPAPTGQFDVIGAGGQFDNSSPFTSGYQILPRDTNDIIRFVATVPTVSFPASSQTQLEDAGTVTITLPIAPAPTAATTVKIFVNNGAGITAADYSTSPPTMMDTITLPVAMGASSVSFDVIITDDMLQESDEDVTLSIVSAGSLVIGNPSTHVFTIQDNDTPIPTYSISQINGVDAMGVADSLGRTVRITGIVTSPSLQANNLDFFLTDPSNDAGLKVFNFGSNFPYNPIMGDELRVVGTIQQFRGQLQIVPDSVAVISSTGITITPNVVAEPAESNEGQVIRLNGVELIDTSNWPSGTFGNFDILLANGDTSSLRLDGDIVTNWGPVPLGKFDVIGNSGQFASSSSAPFTDGYQILPREGAEIIRRIVKLAVTEVMPSSDHPSPIDGDWFELSNFGDTAIDLDGYSWDDDDAIAGSHEISGTYMIQPGESIIFLEALNADKSAWEATWMLQSGTPKIIVEDDFGPIGFSGLSSGGDEVNFYDDKGALISQATYSAADVVAGFSIEFDTAGTVMGRSIINLRGAYASNDGDVGSPGLFSNISIDEFENLKVEIFPNPASDYITIESTDGGEMKITLSDLNGKILKNRSSRELATQISVAHLPAGIYMVSVEINHQKAVRRIIVR